MSTGPNDIPAPPRLEPGQQIGPFTIGQQLDKTPFYQMVLAQYTTSGRPACLLVANNSCPSQRLRLQRMYQLGRKIPFLPEMVRVCDLQEIPHEAGSMQVLVLMDQPKQTLETWLQSHQHDVDRRRSEGKMLIADMINAVEAYHTNTGQLHLNLRPTGFVLVDGRLKLADLAGGFLDFDTPPHRFIGADPAFLAPEMLVTDQREELTPRADIYALGVLLWLILSRTGQPPFQGSVEQLREKHQRLILPQLGCEETIDQAVQGCLAISPDQRYASLSELKAALSGPQRKGTLSPPLKLKQYLTKINDCIQNKLYEKAWQLCQQSLNAEPKNAALLTLNNRLTPRLRRGEEILKQLKTKWNKYPPIQILNELDIAAKYLGPRSESVQCLIPVALIRIQEYYQRLRQIRSYFDRQDWSSALSEAKETLKWYPDDKMLMGLISCLEDFNCIRFSTVEIDNQERYEIVMKYAQEMVEVMAQLQAVLAVQRGDDITQGLSLPNGQETPDSA